MTEPDTRILAACQIITRAKMEIHAAFIAKPPAEVYEQLLLRALPLLDEATELLDAAAGVEL
jgi:hypothetical protein